jgi:hypothetical protein
MLSLISGGAEPSFVPVGVGAVELSWGGGNMLDDFQSPLKSLLTTIDERTT